MKTVFSVGFELPGGPAEYVPFRSDRSLYDADIILFRPTFAGYRSGESYSGHRLIAEVDTSDLVRDCAHWRSELQAIVATGKIVFVDAI